MKLSSAVYTDMANQVPDITVANAPVETFDEYNPPYLKWKGYYDTIPELASVIDRKAMFTVGKGFKADEATKKMLGKIRGCGKDTINDIFYNSIRTYTIGGDSFAEKVDTRRGLRNLKPISPSSIKIFGNSKGIIQRYEQIDNFKKKINSFTPEEIFHLPWNRLADAIHGISTVEKLQSIIDSRNEAMLDMKKVFHRYVKPLIVSEVDTDDPAEIAAYKLKLDKSVELGENMVIPRGTVTLDKMSIPQGSILDPLPWIKMLNQYFIMAEGVPMVVLGTVGSGETEASAKILYLGFQQMVEFNQQFLEQQILAQLGLEINFEFPADLMQKMQETQQKQRNPSNMELNPDATK